MVVQIVVGTEEVILSVRPLRYLEGQRKIAEMEMMGQICRQICRQNHQGQTWCDVIVKVVQLATPSSFETEDCGADASVGMGAGMGALSSCLGADFPAAKHSEDLLLTGVSLRRGVGDVGDETG